MQHEQATQSPIGIPQRDYSFKMDKHTIHRDYTLSHEISTPNVVDLTIDHRDMDSHPQQNTKETW